jgi:hypothetical protein
MNTVIEMTDITMSDGVFDSQGKGLLTEWG